jgi:MoxR-like ATPase
VDRFMLKLVVTYPGRRDEREVLDRMTGPEEPEATRVMEPGRVLAARRVVQQVYTDDRIKEYVLDLVAATRRPADAGLHDLAPLVEFGASPRAAIFLLRAAKAHAFIRGRAYVIPDDVKALGLDVLRHRVILTYRADAEGVGPDALLRRIFEAVPVP